MLPLLGTTRIHLTPHHLLETTRAMHTNFTARHGRPQSVLTVANDLDAIDVPANCVEPRITRLWYGESSWDEDIYAANRRIR